MKNNTYKFSLVKHSLVILLAMVFAFLNIGFFVEITEALPVQVDPSKLVVFDGTLDFDDTISPKTEDSSYISYTEYRTTYCNATDNTSPSQSTLDACDLVPEDIVIKFNTADELYRFSVDVSFEEVYISGVPSEDIKLHDEKIDVDIVVNGDSLADSSRMQSPERRNTPNSNSGAQGNRTCHRNSYRVSD